MLVWQVTIFAFNLWEILKHGKKKQAGYFMTAEEILIRGIRFIFLLSPSRGIDVSQIVDDSFYHLAKKVQFEDCK